MRWAWKMSNNKRFETSIFTHEGLWLVEYQITRHWIYFYIFPGLASAVQKIGQKSVFRDYCAKKNYTANERKSTKTIRVSIKKKALTIDTTKSRWVIYDNSHDFLFLPRQVSYENNTILVAFRSGAPV